MWLYNVLNVIFFMHVIFLFYFLSYMLFYVLQCIFVLISWSTLSLQLPYEMCYINKFDLTWLHHSPPLQVEEETTNGGCLPHKSPSSYLFQLSHTGFFPQRWIQHPAVSLLWGGDEVTNVGQAIRTPRRAELFWPEGNTSPSWISSTHLTHLPHSLTFHTTH